MSSQQLKNQELINQIVSFLKLLREENGLTQEDVYNDTGIHIARIETRRVNISISTLAALPNRARAYLIESINELSSSLVNLPEMISAVTD